MTIPYPKDNDRVCKIADLVLGHNKTFAAAAMELNLTKGQISRGMMDYWQWRRELDGAQRPPAPVAKVVPRIGGNVQGLGRVHSTDVVPVVPKPHPMAKKGRQTNFPSTTKRRQKIIEDIVAPTDEEIFRSYALQVITASRDPRNR